MMRCLIISALAILACSSALAQCSSTGYGGGFTCVQSATIDGSAAINTVTASMGSSVTAGHAVVAMVWWCGNSSCSAAITNQHIQITDGAGSACWSTGASPNTPWDLTDSTGSRSFMGAWVCPSSAGGAGSNNITATCYEAGHSCSYIDLHVSEWTGIASSSVFDVDAAAVSSSNGTTSTVTSAATSHAADLVMSWAGALGNNEALTAGSGYSKVSTSAVNFMTEGKSVSATGTQTATATWTGSDDWATFLIAVKSSASGAAYTAATSDTLAMGNSGAGSAAHLGIASDRVLVFDSDSGVKLKLVAVSELLTMRDSAAVGARTYHLTATELMPNSAVSSLGIAAHFGTHLDTYALLEIATGIKNGGVQNRTAAVSEIFRVLDIASGLGAHFASPSELVPNYPPGSSLIWGISSAPDFVPILDAALGIASHFAAPRDTVALRESGSGHATHGSLTSELLHALDAGSGLGAHLAATLEALRLGDSGGGSAAHYGAAYDRVRVLDSTYALKAKIVTVSERLTLLDAPGGFAAHFGSAADLMSLFDSAAGIQNGGTHSYSAATAELLPLIEKRLQLSLYQTASENASGRGLMLTDSAARQAAHFLAPMETLAAWDAGSGSAGHSVTTMDRLVLIESGVKSHLQFVVVSEQVLLTSALTQHAAHIATPLETVGAYDIWSRMAGHFASGLESLFAGDLSFGLRNVRGPVVLPQHIFSYIRQITILVAK